MTLKHLGVAVGAALLAWNIGSTPAIVAAPSASTVPGEGYPHPMLSDVRVRQGVAYCTNRDALTASVYGFLTPAQRQLLMMDTFLPNEHWAHATPTHTYAYNPTLGQQLLDQAGWAYQPGDAYRSNPSGQTLEFSVTTTTSTLRETYLKLLKAQLAACGIRLKVIQTAPDWLFGQDTGLVRRDFESAAFAWIGEANPSGRSLYGCDVIPNPATAWTGQNFMGWCNDTAHTALLQATQTLTQSTRLAGYTILQEAFAADMISLPLFRRLAVHAVDLSLVGYAPSPYMSAYTWNANAWTLPPYSTIRIGMLQEPGSLFYMQDFSSAGDQVRALVEGMGLAIPASGIPQPILFSSIPTVENGGIIVSPVTVTAGEIVADEDGDIQALAPGMRLINSAGDLVVYTGGAISMPQAKITGSFRSDLYWSDGTPLIQSDLELWDTIQCDPASSLRTAGCLDIAQREYLNATTARYTLVPGLRPQIIWDYLPGAYPSQRQVSGGRLLQDVPPAEWPTLSEVTRAPIGLGPYRLVSWEPGARMVFAPNPYYALGAPETPNLEILFYQTDSAGLTNTLVGGSVDVMGADNSPDIGILLEAQDWGRAKAIYESTTTWEHLDFNLTQLYRLRLPSLQR